MQSNTFLGIKYNVILMHKRLAASQGLNSMELASQCSRHAV
jgi:hypothetical protein